MASTEYICHNGYFHRASEPSLFPGNRGFRYGDSLFEYIHALATEPQFLEFHLERLIDAMQLLSMHVPASFTGDSLRQLITRLLNKNRIFGGAAIRLTVYRDPDESNITQEDGVSFIIESEKLANDKYVLNEKGLSIDIHKSYFKTTNSLSHLRNSNSLLYLLVTIDQRNNNLETFILLNETGRLVETANSNIFLVSGNAIFTPGLSQGCVPGVMRRVVIKLASEVGFRVNDQSSLTPSALTDAEEVFLTNAIEGIRWVGAFQQKRYFKKAAKLLITKLNEIAF